MSDLLTFRPKPQPFMAMVDLTKLCIIRRTMTKLSKYKRLVSLSNANDNFEMKITFEIELMEYFKKQEN